MDTLQVVSHSGCCAGSIDINDMVAHLEKHLKNDHIICFAGKALFRITRDVNRTEPGGWIVNDVCGLSLEHEEKSARIELIRAETELMRARAAEVSKEAANDTK